MTKSTITREQVIALIAEHSYDSALIDALEHLLTAMDSEPVGEFYEDGPLNWYQISDGDRVPDSRRIPLYRHAQQATVVPYVLERLRSIVSDPRALPRRKKWVSGQQYSYVLLDNVEAMVDEACRAAMLNQK